VKLVLTNWDELFPYSDSSQAATDNSMVNDGSVMDACTAPLHPHHPELGNRSFKLGKEVWIERTDFEETPPKGFFRLFPPKVGADGTVVAGNKVRLKYGYVIECTGFVNDDSGKVTEVHATVIPDTKSGTPGSASVKVKGVITWVAVADSLSAEVRLYDRLFTDEHPDAGGKDFLASINPKSLKIIQAIVEPSLLSAKPDDKFQFERHGYFCADRVDSGVGKPVFNLAVGLKDSFGK
jgi:glutaminyl-tRNA synthetase